MVSFRVVLTAALALGVSAAPAPVIRSVDPDVVLPKVWPVQIFPDGPIVTLNGTISSVHEQLLELNPNFDSDFPSFQAEINAMLSAYEMKKRNVQERSVGTDDAQIVDGVANTWQAQAFLDGPILTIVGTVEELHDQLVALNPNFDSDFPSFYNEIALLKWRKELGMSTGDLKSKKRELPTIVY